MTNMPDYLSGVDSSKYKQNFEGGDIETPLVKILQAMSPELVAGDEKFIPGATPGMWVLTTTNEAMQTVKFTPLGLYTGWTVFEMPRGSGGYLGTFAEESEFIQTHVDLTTIKHEFIFNGKAYEATKSGQVYARIYLPNGETTEALITLPSTALKAYRSICTAVQMNKAPQTSLGLELSSVPKRNDKGQNWLLPSLVGEVRYVPEDVFKKNNELFEGFNKNAMLTYTSPDAEGEASVATGTKTVEATATKALPKQADVPPQTTSPAPETVEATATPGNVPEYLTEVPAQEATPEQGDDPWV